MSGSIVYKALKDTDSFGLFRYRSLIADDTSVIGEKPVAFFRDIVFSLLDGNEASYSVVTTEKREMFIDEVEQHTRTEEAIMPMDGPVVLFAGEAGACPPSSWSAFLVPALTMVVFEKGVWHKAPYPLSGTVHSLVVLPPLTYLNDCRIVKLEEPVRIEKEAL